MFQMIFDTLYQPAVAGFVGGAYNYYTETSPEFMTSEAYIKYAGVIALSNLAGKIASESLLPHFSNPQLLTLQKTLVSSATTAGINMVAQRELNSDGRVRVSAISGAIGGAVAPIAGSYISKMFSDF